MPTALLSCFDDQQISVQDDIGHVFVIGLAYRSSPLALTLTLQLTLPSTSTGKDVSPHNRLSSWAQAPGVLASNHMTC